MPEKLTLEETLKMLSTKMRARAISERLETDEQVVYRIVRKIERNLKQRYGNITHYKIVKPSFIVKIDVSKFMKVKYHRVNRV